MDAGMAGLVTDEVFNDLVVHLVLPPNCPHHQDAKLNEINSRLLTLMLESVASFAEQCADEVRTGWQFVAQMLAQWVHIQSTDALHLAQTADLIHPERLEQAMTLLPVRGRKPNKHLRLLLITDYIFIGGLALYLKAQNAGIFMLRNDADHIRFEMFEAAPRNQNAITGESGSIPGRLVRTFPGIIISCPWSMVMDENFRAQFCQAVRDLHEETVHAFQNSMATTSTADHRDSAHPGIVTEMLANMLAASGELLPGGQIIKHTREEVYINNARFPWRRTPMWIVLRVAIERCLAYQFPTADSRVHFKNFILYFLTKIAKKSIAYDVSYELKHLLSIKLARRLAKLGLHAFKFVSDETVGTTKELNQAIQGVWTGIQNAETDANQVPMLDMKIPADQATFPLSHSRDHIMSTMAVQYSSSPISNFKPKNPKRLRTGKGQFFTLLKESTNFA
jgi:hypothetical protein